MATSTIRLDDGVREETTRIASQMGLSFNAVMNIMARKFNEVKGFPFPVRDWRRQKRPFLIFLPMTLSRHAAMRLQSAMTQFLLQII